MLCIVSGRMYRRDQNDDECDPSLSSLLIQIHQRDLLPNLQLFLLAKEDPLRSDTVDGVT